VDVDAVEQRTADFAQVSLDHPGHASAFARAVAIETALTPALTLTAMNMSREGWPQQAHRVVSN
jgi:hypothetical protein